LELGPFWDTDDPLRIQNQFNYRHSSHNLGFSRVFPIVDETLVGQRAEERERSLVILLSRAFARISTGVTLRRFNAFDSPGDSS